MFAIYVTSTADSGSGSLRQAIAVALDGDRILFDETVFPPGTVTTIYLSSVLTVAKEVEVDGDGRVALDGQDSVRCLQLNAAAHIKNLVVRNGATTNGAGILFQGGTPSATNCVVEYCNATGSCGGVYFISESVGTLNNCTIRNCTAGANGGGVYFNNSSQGTLNDCVITNCTAGSSGGGMIATSSSQCVLNRCSITKCTSANYGGAAYVYGTASASFVDCTASQNICTNSATRRGVCIGGTSANVANSTFDALWISGAVATTISSDLSTVGTLTLDANNVVVPTVTFLDGAALSVTSDATIPSAAIFTSETRGYLAVVSDVNTNNATFDNVVLCDYGAGVTSARAKKGVLLWTATDPTVGALIEQQDGDGWTTVANHATSYSTPFPRGAAPVRIFDGEKFLTVAVGEYSLFWRITDWAEYLGGGTDGKRFGVSSWAVDPETTDN